jgi:hypothetical protein
VDHHGALRVTGEDDLGGRALLDECLVLGAECRGAGVDAAHEAHPFADAAVIGHRGRRVLDGLGGHRPAVTRHLRLQVEVGLVDGAAHAGVGGQVAVALSGPGRADEVQIRAAGSG